MKKSGADKKKFLRPERTVLIPLEFKPELILPRPAEDCRGEGVVVGRKMFLWASLCSLNP
jgi:hypothetical protein